MAETDAVAEKILKVAESLAITQALDPNTRDGAGFSNADFPAAFALVALGDVAGCAALLQLYARQAKAQGIKPADLKPWLGESDFTNTEARSSLSQARKGAEGTLAWIERQDGILFNGIGLNQEVKKALKDAGKKVAQGWVVPKSRIVGIIAKADEIAKKEELQAIAEATPQVAPDPSGKPVPPPLAIHYGDGEITWTQPFSDEGVAIRGIVKRLGARFNPDTKGWTLGDPVALQALLTLAQDFDAPVIGITHEPGLDEPAESLVEEVHQGVVKVIIVAQTEHEVCYRLRSKVEGAWEKARSVGAIYDRNAYGGSIRVDKAALRDLCAKLDSFTNIDLSPFLPIISKYEVAQVQAIDPEILAAIPSQTPTGFNFFDHQRDGMAFLMTLGLADERIKGGILADDMGLGKMSPLSEPILTPQGWKTMGDIKVGDYVIGSSGKPIKVLGVYPQVDREVWAVTFSDGVVVRCGPEHLWTVRNPKLGYRGRGWITRTARELKEMGLSLNSGASKFEIPQFPGHNGRAVPSISPWLLGQILGNGYAPGCRVEVASNISDKDVVERLCSLGGRLAYEGEGVSRVVFNKGPNGDLLAYLESRGLNVRSKNKFIPEECFQWSRDNRIELLRGLMDSDGSNQKNRITFHSCSPKLAEGVAQLVRSLGGAAVVRQYDRSEEGKPLEFHVNVHAQFCPFSSARKSEGWKADWRKRGNRIKSMERVEDEDCVCILVDSPDHLYVATGYKLTHNTLQAVCAANSRFPNGRILIVCPASLKANWRNEIRKWLGPDETVQIMRGTTDVVDSSRWVVVNYDIILNYVDQLRAVGFDLLIADEAHNLRNPETQRSIAVAGCGAKRAKGDRPAREARPGIAETCQQSWMLTGTPILNRTKELFNLLKIIGHPLGQDWWRFASRYCGARSNGWGMNFNGASNLGELAAKMANCYLKRLKKDVLNLPPKIQSPRPVDLTDAELKAYHDAVDAMLGRLDGQDDDDACILAELNALKLQTARIKMANTVEAAREVVDEGGKVLVFTFYKEVLDALQDEFGTSCVRIDGSVAPAKRQDIVDNFQNDPSKMVFLGQIEAAGVGLTLTAAQTVLVNDYPWTPGILYQAEDRAYRIGQNGTVNVYYQEAEGTFDAKLKAILDDKNAVIDAFETGADIASKARMNVVKKLLKEIKKDAAARAASAVA